MSENKYKPDEVVVDVWGDFAMFARPESSPNHVTYPVPTPSAMRNLLCAIYAKPKEFYYQITKIEIMNPVKTIAIKKNEIKSKADRNKIIKNENATIYLNGKAKDNRAERTQRNYIYLKDVYYRIYAKLVLNNACEKNITITSIRQQFERRVTNGKCFSQPFLGTRECMAFFSKPNFSIKPIKKSENFGNMLYDVFDPRINVPINTADNENSGKKNIMFYSCQMVEGVINVPSVEEEEVKKIA